MGIEIILWQAATNSTQSLGVRVRLIKSEVPVKVRSWPSITYNIFRFFGKLSKRFSNMDEDNAGSASSL